MSVSTMALIDETIFDIITGFKDRASLKRFGEEDLDEYFHLFPSHGIENYPSTVCETCSYLGYYGVNRCKDVVTLDSLMLYLHMMPRPTIPSGFRFIHNVHLRFIKTFDEDGFMCCADEVVSDVDSISNSVWPEMTPLEAWNLLKYTINTPTTKVHKPAHLKHDMYMIMCYMYDWLMANPLGRRASEYLRLGWSRAAFVKGCEQGLDVPTFKPDSIEGMIWLSENNMNLDGE